MIKLASPICGAQEHDSIFLHRKFDEEVQPPDPPATEVVNSAVTIFAVAFPLQSPRVQEGVLEQLAAFLTSPQLHRDPGRRAAVMVNSAMALLGALKVAIGETVADRGDLKHHPVEKTIEEILKVRHVSEANVFRLAYGIIDATHGQRPQHQTACL